MRNMIPIIFVVLVGGLYTIKQKNLRNRTTPSVSKKKSTSALVAPRKISPKRTANLRSRLGHAGKKPAFNKQAMMKKIRAMLAKRSKQKKSLLPFAKKPNPVTSKKPAFDRQAMMRKIRAMLARRKKQRLAKLGQKVPKASPTTTPTKKPAFNKQALMQKIRAMLAKRRRQQALRQQAAKKTNVATSSTPAVTPKGSVVELQTSMGSIQLKLFTKKAPLTTANFLRYVRSGHYNGTIFHRVIPNFMVQGGGLNAKMMKKPTRAPIKNEAFNGLKNELGTVAMARTGNPHSASAQFFINTKNNRFLNFRGRSGRAWGYCVFAKVIKGMDVVAKISATRTGSLAGRRNVPVTPILIKKAIVLQ